MLNSKYSKVLTVILIIAIIAIIGLLIFLGIDWYRATVTQADADDFMNQFDDYVNNIGNTNTNTDVNNNTELIEPNIDINNTVQNTQTGGSSDETGLTYKGYKVIGKIEIPATDVEYPILEEATPGAIQVAIGKLYGVGVNEVGNMVLVGHNFRNGTFFSNNKNLELGDKIYITDLQGNRVTYTISNKYTTTTGEFDYAGRDTNGKREISLSTCTDDTKNRLIIWAVED